MVVCISRCCLKKVVYHCSVIGRDMKKVLLISFQVTWQTDALTCEIHQRASFSLFSFSMHCRPTDQMTTSTGIHTNIVYKTVTRTDLLSWSVKPNNCRLFSLPLLTAWQIMVSFQPLKINRCNVVMQRNLNWVSKCKCLVASVLQWYGIMIWHDDDIEALGCSFGLFDWL